MNKNGTKLFHKVTTKVWPRPLSTMKVWASKSLQEYIQMDSCESRGNIPQKVSYKNDKHMEGFVKTIVPFVWGNCSDFIPIICHRDYKLKKRIFSAINSKMAVPRPSQHQYISKNARKNAIGHHCGKSTFNAPCNDAGMLPKTCVKLLRDKVCESVRIRPHIPANLRLDPQKD